MLAGMVVQACKYDYVTPILAELHWLPLEARIHYKIALMTFNVFTTQQLHYFFELLQLHQPVRQLRSSLNTVSWTQIVPVLFSPLELFAMLLH